MRAGPAAVLLLSCIAAAGEDGDPVRYVRGSTTIAAALDQVGGLLSAADVASVVIVFEQSDFGERERGGDEPDYHAQLPEWLEAVKTWSETREERVRVALTGSGKPLAARAAPALAKEARRAHLVAAERWLERLAHFPKGKRGALVYVSGPPVTWETRFRTRPRSWDVEAVAAWLGRSGARLYVVMPEARFPDFLPEKEFVDLAPTWWRVPVANNRERRFQGGWASWETDCPSAYGFAAYARAAAATRGAYVFYPARTGDWLDPCPFNVGLLAELLPRLPAPLPDPLLAEIAESTRRCAPLGAFESVVAFPYEEAREFRKLAAAARANADLCAAESDRLAAVGVEGASRRSLAQLRYSRFLLEACAFHCAAWADVAEAAEEFAARGEGRDAYAKADLKVHVGSSQRIEMRRVLGPVADYPRADADARWAEALPPALRGRAERVVAAAGEVMRHDGLSPWGWMVWYSDIVTFKPYWWGTLKGGPERRKPGSESADTETPSDPPAAPGSGGSGPKTGG